MKDKMFTKIGIEDLPKEKVHIWKIKEVPTEFNIRISVYNFYRVSSEMLRKEDELDPSVYLMYRHTKYPNAYILINKNELTMELHLPKFKGKVQPKVESLTNSVARWEQ